ncbi:MAG: hypothetical protein JJU28_15560 [Cyclobacteriaceae bacterium]|nr:hypothetical protein [Cyclobacteriaceae bacterium]
MSIVESKNTSGLWIRMLVIPLALAVLFQCSAPESSEKSKAYTDSVAHAFVTVKDSVNAAWNRMIQDDDEKLFYMKRLLLEVSYTGVYDVDEYNRLIKLVDSLHAFRYDQFSMMDSDLIDQYDDFSSDVTYQVVQYARTHPEFEKYGLMQELISDISEKNGNLLLFRIHYDNHVRDYNQMMQDEKSLLEKLYPDSAIQTMPMFALPG